MVGRKLAEIELRSQYRVSVFLVKEMHEHGEMRYITPSAGYIFRRGDTLLLSGNEKDIEILKHKI
jgi:K+/H+ antiporter YhaU regulatory subunit KhtT